jgi:DNA-binding HxlR family transcriptional regulator
MKLKPKPKTIPDPAPNCPLNDCLQFLAGAWTTEVIWYLQSGPRRFGDLQRDLQGVSSKVLATRLKELEGLGIVARRVNPTKPPTVEYRLTELGQQFRPVLNAISSVAEELRARLQTKAVQLKQRRGRLGRKFEAHAMRTGRETLGR